VPFVNFPVGHNRAGNVEGTVCDPFLGHTSARPRAQSAGHKRWKRAKKISELK
jgi:hypothetical protein